MDKRFSGTSTFLPLPHTTIKTRCNRKASLAIALFSSLLLGGCNEFEPAANNTQASSSPAVSIATTVQTLIDAGHPALTANNAKHASTAPTGEGFTLAITGADITDSRLVAPLTGNITLHGDATITQQMWLQREGPAAFILNANTAQATALLPQVKTATTLSFGWLAVDSEFYVDEQLTSVPLLGNKAPFSVTTRAQSELYSQLTLEIALDAPASQATQLHYQTQNGTALANEDYLATSGSVVFEVGQRSKLITVPLLSDPINANANNEGDEYFKVLLSGSAHNFTGTVHGYGVIYNNSAQDANAPTIANSTVAQNTLMGSAGLQRAYLEYASTGLLLSVTNSCSLGQSASCNQMPLEETGEGWANIAWPNTPATVQSYSVTNITSAPINYAVTIFDGEQTRLITGTAPANQRINVYTAGSDVSISSSSTSSNSSSSSAAIMPTQLKAQVQTNGIAATSLALAFSFDNTIAIDTLTADLNGSRLAANTLLDIPFAQLVSGLNTLQVNASDAQSNSLSRAFHIYFADGETNTFIGDGDSNIFIGREGVDTFTGGDGTNIYVAGSNATTLINGAGQNIFILQDGTAVTTLEAQGDFADSLVMPDISINALRIRQYDENSFYLTSEEQGMSLPHFFTPEGDIQSSIQRFIFADGELSATDIRQRVHAPSINDDNYWGFNGDDTLIDTEGDDNAFGGGGNDTLTVNGLADGGDGDDIINAGTAYGGNGNDTIIASDYADGGEGNDTIQANTAEGGDGDDTLSATGYANGGAGNDLITQANTAEGGDGDDVIHATSPFGGAGNDTLYTLGINAFGGDGDDTLYGNELNNSLFGELGNDVLYGYAGNDSLFAGEGHSTMDGGDGDDELFAAQGDFDDILIGGNGNDMMWGYDGNNTFDGGPGDETFFAGNGNNSIDCGEGIHNIFGNDAGNDTIVCGSGDDTIHLAQGNDDVKAGAGNDQIYASGSFSSATSAEDAHAGNKNILLEDGDDELRLSDGLSCYADGGDGNDLFYASCQQFTVNGGSGNDTLYLSAFFQLSVTGGTGDDEFNIGQNNATPHTTLAGETAFLHYYWAPGDGNDTYQLASMLPDESDEGIADERASERFDNSHFYLGGDITSETITLTQNQYTSLILHYRNPESGAVEMLTFSNWFNLQTGQANGENFKDFQFQDDTVLSTQSINNYFNQFYHRNFDAENRTGLSAEGTPMTTDQIVVSEQSVLIDNENYFVKKDHQFTTNNWTLEFWLLPPPSTTATTPILQWGEMPEGTDGFGLALHNIGEGYEWRLQIGNENSVSVYDAGTLNNPIHIAITQEDQQLQLFVNGRPSNNTLATLLPAETIAPLNLGYFDISNAETAAWYLDELLITQGQSKYSAPFTPERTPTALELDH